MYFMINNQLDEIYNLGLTSKIDILAVNKNRKSIHQYYIIVQRDSVWKLMSLFNFDLKF